MKRCGPLGRQRRVLLPRGLRAPHCGQANCLPTFLIGFGLVLVYGFSDPSAAVAQTCTTSGSIITCAAGGTFMSTGANAASSGVTPAAGEGQQTPSSITTIDVEHGATLEGTNVTSLSGGNDEAINIGETNGGATLTTTTNTGSNTGGSRYSGTGPNALEAGANNTITIFPSSSINAVAGNNNGNPESEAINVMGFGNTIINKGTLFSNTSSAIFLQNDPSLITTLPGGGAGNTNLTVPGVAGTFGTVIMNFGTINAEAGANAATSTEAIAETPQSNPSASNANRNVYFANEPGGVVDGNVVMGNGNDTVELFSGSTINGNLSGGPNPYAGNKDTLALDAATAPGTLNGTLTDFDILTKTGTFPWEITGALSSNRTLAAEVQQGTLVLSGNTPTLNGTMIVDSGATLQIGNGGNTGSFGANITDNGIVAFDRSDSPGLTYSNVISGAGQVQQIGSGMTTLTGTNTYSGGTFFNNGTLAAAADSNLGTGGLTFNGGTFQYDSGFTLSARPITINAPGGTIDTQTFNPTIVQGMTGDGALTKTGSGALILTGANTYAGGTTISAGSSLKES
jgi:fibronectin-binding autotransporter adhesin